jgi:hypothetical protein
MPQLRHLFALSVLIFATGLAVNTSALASGATATSVASEVNQLAIDLQNQSITAGETAKIVAELKKINRGPASIFGEGNMKPSLIRFRNDFLAAKTDQDVDALLNKYDASYATLDPDAQYFVAQLIPLRSLRGIIWRMRPIVEQGFLGMGTRTTQAMAVSELRSIAAAVAAYLPTEQWAAGLEYVSKPSDQFTSADQFKSVSELQAFLLQKGSVADQFGVAIQRVKTINQTTPPQTIFVWDAKMAYGTGAFKEGLNEFLGHGYAERHATVSSLELIEHGIFLACSYNLDELPNVISAMGKLYGMDGFNAVNGSDFGVSAKDRDDVVRSFAKKNFLALRTDDGKANMLTAYNSLLAATKEAQKAHDTVSKLPANDNMAMNPIFFDSRMVPQLTKGITILLGALNGNTPISSRITGETVTINIKSFYMNPPNLISLLPTDTAPDTATPITSKKSGENLTYRDYHSGAPIAWDNNAWSVIVPSAKGQSAGYMGMANKVLSSSLGTNQIWLPMSGFFL